MGEPKLSENYFGIDLLNKLRKVVEAEDKVAIRVPLSGTSEKDKAEEKETFFESLYPEESCLTERRDACVYKRRDYYTKCKMY